MLGNNSTGKVVENLVRSYLEEQGLVFVSANYRCRYGEIDLIMHEGTTIVFIEVRHRKSANYGDGVATVTKSKQHKIIKTATHYLQHKQLSQRTCRFDIVATSGVAELELTWIQDAFWVQW